MKIYDITTDTSVEVSDVIGHLLVSMRAHQQTMDESQVDSSDTEQCKK